jgi:hypothetical protein
VTFTALDVGSEYEVAVSAVSPAGYSETAIASRITIDYLNDTPTSYPSKGDHFLDFTVEVYGELQIKDVICHLKYKGSKNKS